MNSPTALKSLTTELSQEGGSQVVKVQLRLGEMILAGELPGGTTHRRTLDC